MCVGVCGCGGGCGQVSMSEDELNEKAAAQGEIIANIASVKEELQSREAQLRIFEVSWY